MAYLDLGGLTRFFAGIRQQFVSKSAIQNDLSATEEGSVLDARQGKELKEQVDQKAETNAFVATLPAAGWSAAAPYTQTVELVGILSTDTPLVDVVVSDSAAIAKKELEEYGYVGRVDAGSGRVTVTCYEDKPTVNLQVALKVVR